MHQNATNLSKFHSDVDTSICVFIGFSLLWHSQSEEITNKAIWTTVANTLASWPQGKTLVTLCLTQGGLQLMYKHCVVPFSSSVPFRSMWVKWQESNWEVVSFRSLLMLLAPDEPQWGWGQQSSPNVHWHFGSRRDGILLLETSDILCVEFFHV